MTDEQRQRGLEAMKEVYGWDITEVPDGFMAHTIDQLFGEIWSRDVLSVRDRRLVLVGLLVGLGEDEVEELILDAAHRLDELAPEELRELVIFLSYYAGWTRATKLNTAVEKILGP